MRYIALSVVRHGYEPLVAFSFMNQRLSSNLL